ncbi:MAG: phage DNA packaging protein J [Alphaproteobacteria bacterium]|nr:phage DNA packaging protein J [Alphaproteobacteria bacterium]
MAALGSDQLGHRRSGTRPGQPQPLKSPQAQGSRNRCPAPCAPACLSAARGSRSCHHRSRR